jgi:xanthine dehydrogenase accessory factor
MIGAPAWLAAADALAAGRRAFVALVVDHTRHSPGTRGATLAIVDEGPPIGTIGGGGMEADVVRAGRAALAGPADARIVTLHHRSDAPGARSGLVCAGRQTNLYAVLEPAAHGAALAEAAARLRGDRAGVLVIGPDGAARVEDGAPDPARPPVERADEGVRIQLLRQDRAVIFGGGHCGLALSRQLAWLGFHVTVAEVRADLFTLTANDWADEALTGPDFADLAGRVRHPEITFAVVMTANLGSDVRALRGALRAPFPFVGVMGAPAKIARIREALAEAGFAESDLARITAPVGLPIPSDRPEEIAVSVAAQILQLRPSLFPGRAPSPLDEVPP